MAAKTRFLKWVGMPPVLQSDGFRVHDWKYENWRPIAVTMPPGHPGQSKRVMEAGIQRGFDDHPVRLSKTYWFEQDKNWFVTEVDFTDAIAIMTVAPHEFIDVTDMPRERWPTVRNEPIIVGASQDSSAAPHKSSVR